MRHDDEALLEVVAELKQELVKLLGTGAVEVAAGLVGEDDGGVVDEGAGDGDALLLAPAHLVGLVVLPVGQAEVFQELQGAAVRLVAGRFLDVGRQADVLQRRELGQEVVELEDEADGLVAEGRQFLFVEAEDVLPADAEGAGVRPVQRPEDVQERGFARAGFADDGHHLRPGHGQVHPLENVEGVVGFADVGGLEHVGRGHPARVIVKPKGNQSNTTVRFPKGSTRCWSCRYTARERTRFSTSFPIRFRSAMPSRWETRATSWAMIGPSSRSAVT